MIIGIDGNEANVKKRVGIGEYTYELLKQFSNTKSNFRIYLKNKPLDHLPIASKHWQYSIVGPKRFWTQYALPLHLLFEKNKPDIFFSPSHYAPRFSPVPTAIAIMDVSYLHFPEMFKKKDLIQLRSWTKYSVKNARKIFTISQSSKNDIMKYYHISKENIIVTYPGVKGEIMEDEERNSFNSITKKYGITGKYILFVGTLQPRKNIIRLIEAFSKVNKPGFQLLIVGKKGWLFEEILTSPKKFGVEDEVKFLNFVPNEDLSMLYRNAVCYVLPSLYEGFGLPILEAMQFDCPVITSNISSLPEAGGDAALYVNPFDTDDIAKKISSLCSDKKLRKELILKGRKQIKKFSWEKTAKQTLEVLEEIAK